MISYDHRLRELVHRTGDLTIATDLGVPPSTARGWLGTAPTVVVSLEAVDLTKLELRQKVLTLQRRVQKLAALLRPALVLLRVSATDLGVASRRDVRAREQRGRAARRRSGRNTLRHRPNNPVR